MKLDEGLKVRLQFRRCLAKELVHCGSAVRKRFMVHILNLFVAMPSHSL